MSKIVVTGGSGLVGQRLKNYLPEAVYLSSKDYDLTDTAQVAAMYDALKPDIVIHLAARVGGIMDNITRPAEYFRDNVLMNTALVDQAYKHGVERFIGILSTCIYPDVMPHYPMKEEDMHAGPPTATNFSYGYAKRCLAVQIDAYNKQYGTKYNYLIPCNLYGLNDKEDVSKSHFVTALVRKIYDANVNKQDHIQLFGDGTPLRQFMYADDFAKVIFEVIDKNIYDSFNVAANETCSIDEIARIALKACESEHLKIVYDTTKPNGQFRKDVSNDRINSILPDFNPLTLAEGIKRVYKNYFA